MVKVIISDISEYVEYIQIAEQLSIIDRMLDRIYEDDTIPDGDAIQYIWPLMKGVQKYEGMIREMAASYRQNIKEEHVHSENR